MRDQEGETLLLHHHHHLLLLQGFLARGQRCSCASESLSLSVCVYVLCVARRKIQHHPPLSSAGNLVFFPGNVAGARWCVMMTVASRVIEL